jgi:Family of unknown function (DUF5723)
MATRLVLILLFFATGLTAQEQFGASPSNYTPTLSVFTNPSSMVDSKTWLDIHIIGAGAYAMNNLAYVENSGIVPLIRQRERQFDNSSVKFDRNRNNYKVYNRNFVNVLSGVWSQGDHAAGLFFNARSYTMVRGISNDLIGIIDSSLVGNPVAKNQPFDFSNIYMSSVNFGEIQLSYGYTFYKKRRDMLMGGISIKKFIPIAGAGLQVNELRFNLASDTSFNYLFANMDAMFVQQSANFFKGGMGLDLGVTYQKMEADCRSYYPNTKKMGCRTLNYKYKVGLSILDIGSVKFNEDDVQSQGVRINLPNLYYTNYTDVDTDTIFQAIQTLDTILSDEDIKNVNKVHLPTALSVQFDYNVWNSKLYAFGSLMQGLPISQKKFGLRRANSIVIGARFESRIFDFAIPISLYDYTTPQIGLSMRIYCLTIGTDKLLSLFGNTDLYGGDIYAHLKIPIFYNPKCRKKGRSGHKDYNPNQIRKKKSDCDAYQ